MYLKNMTTKLGLSQERKIDLTLENQTMLFISLPE